MVAQLGRADECVARNVKLRAHLTEIARHLVGEIDRGPANLADGLVHLEPMLVGPCHDIYIADPPELKPPHDTGSNHSIDVAANRTTSGLIDNREEHEYFNHSGLCTHAR